MMDAQPVSTFLNKATPLVLIIYYQLRIQEM
jgi:hypothetical protein